LNSVEEIKILYDDPAGSILLGNYLRSFFYGENSYRDVIIVCIGTDKCIGDCLGPLVGTLLENTGFPFPVYGTLKNPIHAVNLREKVTKIRKEHPLAFTIAIDACLGEPGNVGSIQVRQGPIYPGKGVGKSLPSVGDISVIGIIDCIRSDSNIALHNIRLSFVMEIAEVMANGLESSIDV